MRRKSAATHQRALQMEEMEKEKENEDEEAGKKRTKTFKSIMEDR